LSRLPLSGRPDRWLEEGGRALRKLGFTKKRNTWRREDERGITVVDLQDSRYGPDFYLEIGIHRGSVAAPKITDCLGRERVEHKNRDVPEVVDEMMRWFERTHTAIEQANAARTPPPAPRERVRHAKFGAGSVAEDRGTSVRVEFDDGTTRLLGRSFLETLT
jgi:hypothetical protein